MALPIYLQDIKSSGLYRFEWDKSVSLENAANTLRLIIGYSEKGRYNTPVYIKNSGEFKTEFGGINKRLEKKGIYFHRLALQALEAGPILALNLKNFDTEKVKNLGVDINGTIVNSETADSSLKELNVYNDNEGVITSIFDTNRFWYISKDAILDQAKYGSDNKYLNITNTSDTKDSATVFVRKATVSGYEGITVYDYYTNILKEDMPEYFATIPSALIADYFVEVYVFKGQFTPAIVSSSGLSEYFEVDGTVVSLKSSIQDSFENELDTLNALAAYEGSNFIGQYVGSTIPYFKNAKGDYDVIDLNFNADNYLHKLYMSLDYKAFEDGAASTQSDVLKPVAPNDGVWKFTYNEETGVYSKDTTSVNPKTGLSYTIIPTVPLKTLRSATWGTSDWDFDTTSTVAKEALEFNAVADAWATDITITSGETTVTKGYLVIGNTGSGESVSTKATTTLDAKLTIGSKILIENKQYTIASKVYLTKTTEGGVTTYTESETAPTTWTENNFAAYKLNDEIDHTSEFNPFYLTKLTPTQMLEKIDYKAKMTPSYIAGYTYTKINIKTSTPEVILQECLKVISDLKGIHTAMTDNVSVRYRYLIDTFAGQTGASKNALFTICKEKQNSFAIVNYPSFDVIKNDSQCKTVGKLDMTKVKARIPMPSNTNGASWGAYYTCLRFQDPDSTALTYVIPSAALVSNLYMDKFGLRQEFDIVAGPNYGRINESYLVGPDYNFSRADLDILEPYGLNCMVYTPQFGTFINANQTAKQIPVSTLSKINVRELVICIQDRVHDVLQNYQWEFNTEALRNTIKSKVDKILENIKFNEGLYDFYTVCDETNNTDDVINNEMLLISIHIEPAMGAGKMVQEITLYKKGGLSSTVNA